jgi:hypothetical protein
MNGKDERIVCGRGVWKKGRGGWGRMASQPVAASGAWTENGVFTARLCFYQTPFIETVRLAFDRDRVHVTRHANVGFGRLKSEALVGTVQHLGK